MSNAAAARVKTLNANTIVNGDLTVGTNHSLELSTFDLNVAGTTALTGGITDASTTGTNTFATLNFTGGSIASSATAAFGITTLNCATGNGTLGQGDFNISGTTSISALRTLTITNVLGAKTFNDITVDGIWTNNLLTPAIITVNGNLTVNAGATFTANTAIYTFGGTGKSIGGTAAYTIQNTTFNGTYTNTNSNASGLSISTNLRGLGTLTQGSGTKLNLGNLTLFDITGFDATVNPNTVDYNVTGVQNIRGTTYHHLTISGGNTKTLLANTTVNGNLNVSAGTLNLGTIATIFTVAGTATIAGTLDFNTITSKAVTISDNLNGIGTITMGNGAIHTLNLGGATNSITTYTAPTVDQVVNYNRAGDQTIFASTNYRILNISGSGIKSLQGITTVNRGINVNAGTLTLNSNTLNVFVSLNIAAGATLDVNTNATLAAGAANIPLTNSGTFKVVGLAGFPAIVNGTAVNYFNISQTIAGATFAAKYYQFNWLRNGIKISNGIIDNVNNL